MKDLSALTKELNEMRGMLAQILPKVSASIAPVSLTDAAEACGVRKAWLLDQVQRKQITAFRPAPESPWRVYVSDVVELLKRETNIEPVRRQSRLGRRAA